MRNTFNQASIDRGHLRRCVLALVIGAILATSVFASRATSTPIKTHIVVIENMRFSPEVLHVRVGDHVVFINEDLVPHTATSDHGPRFDSGLIEAGARWSVSPKSEGTTSYHCAFHPTMKGAIVATAKD